MSKREGAAVVFATHEEREMTARYHQEYRERHAREIADRADDAVRAVAAILRVPGGLLSCDEREALERAQAVLERIDR